MSDWALGLFEREERDNALVALGLAKATSIVHALTDGNKIKLAPAEDYYAALMGYGVFPAERCHPLELQRLREQADIGWRELASENKQAWGNTEAQRSGGVVSVQDDSVGEKAHRCSPVLTQSFMVSLRMKMSLPKRIPWSCVESVRGNSRFLLRSSANAFQTVRRLSFHRPTCFIP